MPSILETRSLEPKLRELKTETVQDYSEFFEGVVGRLAFYTDEEKETAIALHQPDVLRNWLNDDRRLALMVVDQGGDIIALADARIVLSKARNIEVGCLNWILVDESARGRGVATTLYDEIERRFLARGCAQVIASVKKDNAASMAFHERLGFRPSTIMHKSDQSLILMKTLAL